MRKSICIQAELAFAACLTASLSSTALNGVNVYAASQVPTVPGARPGDPPVLAPITTPFLVLKGESPVEQGFDTGIYELKLHAILATQIDDEMKALADSGIHGRRLEDLRDLIEDDAIYAALNPPFDGATDLRPVQPFSLSAVAFEGDDTAESDRRIVTTVTYYLAAGL